MASNIVKYGGGFILFCAALATLGLIGIVFFPNSTATPTAAPVSDPQQAIASAPQPSDLSQTKRIQPESLVKFPDSSIACMSKVALGEVSQRLLAGEKTKASAYFIDRGGPCLMLDRKLTYKVLATEYNAPDMPDLGIMEIVGNGADSTEGFWVFTAGAVVKNEPK